jgi:subtilisin family serine protease
VRRAIVAISVVLSLGVMPAAADDSVAPPADPQWAQPAASVSQDAASLVEQAGDSGAMTIVYAVQDGDSLVIETEQVPTPAQAEQTIADVQQQSDVVAVDVDAPRRLTSLPGKPLALDPSRGEQWALDMLKAEQAWDYSEGAGVVVAVLDSGVSRHQDLAGSFVRGVDMVDGLDPRLDDNGHGTHVAGIMAMSANNAEGGTGLAPQVSIMSVKVADSSGWVSAADSARGIIWAVDKGADVLNMSYSGSASSVEQKAIEYALSKGVLPVAAVGNAYLDSGGSLYNPIQYPAAYKGVVGVGAVTRSLTRSSFSEVGKQVDLVAPGGSGMFNSQKGIFSTFADGRYVRMPGTSMATPYVSATAALTIARQRSLGISVPTPDLLMGTAVDLGPAGRDDEFGFGLVDPVAALAKLTAIASTGAALPTVDPSEVQTRLVHQITLRARPGILRYRIPATGEFVVAIQRVKNKKWSRPTKFKGLRKGRTWYALTAKPGLKVRIIAVRNDALGKNDPVWVSPTMRTRGKR